jgi:hypothetical protein
MHVAADPFWLKELHQFDGSASIAALCCHLPLLYIYWAACCGNGSFSHCRKRLIDWSGIDVRLPKWTILLTGLGATLGPDAANLVVFQKSLSC